MEFSFIMFELKLIVCYILFDSQKELYSGSSDRQILVWAPPKHVPMDEMVSILAIIMFLLTCD